MRVSRRSFLSAGAAGLAAGAFASCRRFGENRPPLVVPTGPEDAAWSAVKAQFATVPEVAYLNNASLGMPPAAVAEEVAHGFLLHSQDPIRAKHELTGIVTERTHPLLAGFLGAHVDEIALTRNATEALHLAAVGLRLERGDEVIITTQEHPAGRRPWRYRQVRNGVVLREVFIPSPLDSATGVVDRIASAFNPRTRAVAFCHVTRGGHRYPVAELCAAARGLGITTIVDGAQAVGMFPVDLHALGCDAYAASLHKWLLGPVGTGVLYVRREARDRFRSAFDADASADRPGFAPGGTADLPIRAALATAVDFVERIGIDTIAARNRLLSDYLKRRLAESRGTLLLSGSTAETSAPGSTIFEWTGVDPFEAVEVLAGDGLHIDEHARDGHSAIRVSTHFYNTREEIERVVEALTRMNPTNRRPGSA